MILLFNDLSSAGRFPTPRSVVDALLVLYISTRDIPLRLVVTRTLLARPAIGHASMYDVIAGASQAQKGLLLGWLAKSGPFADDEELEVENDLWWYGPVEVSEQGLGQAARRQWLGHKVATFSSSEGCDGSFDVTPIEVVQGFPDEVVQVSSIVNIWSTGSIQGLQQAVAREPTNWPELVAECTTRFRNVEIDEENFLQGVQKHPFSGNVVRRSFALLDVLDRIASELDSDGALSETGMALVADHFQGGKAWFSDENPSDENVFWFPDHRAGGRVYCSWHGKIKTPQFRLHFQWPVPPGQKYIKALYLGEKLTKK